MRNGWAIGALALVGRWDSARLDVESDDAIEEARIPPGVDFDGTMLWEGAIDGLLHVAGDSDLAATVRDDQGTALRFLDGSSGVEVGRIALPEGTRGAVVDGSRIVSWEGARVASWSF